MKARRLCCVIASLLAGCVPHTDTLSAKLDAATVSVNLSSVKNATSGENGVLVYGRIEITSLEPIAAANLSCIGLVVGSAASKKTYVDSVASVMNENFPARNGKVATKLYWFLPALEASQVKLDQAKIDVREQLGRCIRYGTDKPRRKGARVN